MGHFLILYPSSLPLSFLSNDCTYTVPVLTPKYSDKHLHCGYYDGMLKEPNPPQAKPIKKILLYGNSILIAGLTSKLGQVEGLEVTQMVEGELGDISNMNMIVVDLREGKTSQALPILCAAPGVVLVGMDAITNTLTVLTSQSHTAQSMQDVLEVLKKVM